MRELKIDAEFLGLIPNLPPSEMGRLASSISSDGCIEPIFTWQGTIVDGHNRYEICTTWINKLNPIEFKTQEIEFKDRDAAISWILDRTLKTRKITRAQYKRWLNGAPGEYPRIERRVKPGFVYVINHKWMDDIGHVKVGKTTRKLETRLNELKVAAALPLPYTLLAAYYVTDATKGEALVHEALSEQRVDKSEWFADNGHGVWGDDGVIVTDVAKRVLQDSGLIQWEVEILRG